MSLPRFIPHIFFFQPRSHLWCLVSEGWSVYLCTPGCSNWDISSLFVFKVSEWQKQGPRLKSFRMAETGATFKLSKYKSPHEPEAHWKLRKAFLKRYMGEMPEDRLVCLAQCFVNHEILGCSYPEKTMKKIEKMKEGIADVYEEFEASRSQRAQKIIVGSHSRLVLSYINRCFFFLFLFFSFFFFFLNLRTSWRVERRYWCH